jgi:bifunctional non-homologous end joining protein LigD
MSQDAQRIDPSVVPGARPAPSPGFIEPCRPALREEAPSGGRWIHEIKFDGYRAQAHLRTGQPAVYTRAGYDWTLRFQTIADALRALPSKDLILDGEAVVADSPGVPDLGLLPADLTGSQGPAALLRLRPALPQWVRSARSAARQTQAHVP